MNQFEALEQEEQIIRYLFDNHHVQKKSVVALNPNYFDDELIQNIVKNIIVYRDKYDKFPNAKTFYSLMKPGTTKEKFLHIMKMAVDDKDAPEIQDFVTKFFKVKMTLNCLRDQIGAIQEGNTEQILQLLPSMESAVNFSLSTDVGIDVEEDLEDVISRLQEFSGTVPSALQFINDKSCSRRAGGFYKSALSLFMGQAGVGKSLMMCNEASYSLRTGRKVLYITLELSEEVITQRIVANVADIDYKEIDVELPNQLEISRHANNLKDRMRGFKTAEGGSVLIKYIPSGSKPSDVDRVIEEVHNSKGYQLDLVIVDYIGEMNANGANSRMQRPEMLGHVARQLRNIAAKHKLAMISASQINRDGYDSTAVSMKNTSDSAVLNHVSDLLISVTQDDLLKSNTMLCHKIIKNRNGPKDDVFFSKIWWQYMRVKDATDEQIQQYTTTMVSEEDSGGSFSGRPAAKSVSLGAGVELPIIPEDY